MQKIFYSWQESLCREQKAPLCTLLIFGGSGDLATRKLFPALFALFRKKLMHPETKIITCARHPYDTDSFRAKIFQRLKEITPSGDEQRKIPSFLEKVSYCILDYGREKDFLPLAEQIGRSGLLISYLALPPTLYAETVRNLSAAGLLEEDPGKERRCHVVFEKPFGLDLKSFHILDRELKKYLREEQIYRIDHYLGKETVQNIFLLRFANVIFEEVWNRKHIDSIQIIAAEDRGVGTRGRYFDQAGILRDMFQNHLLEMLSLVTMECPAFYNADAIRSEKLKLIRSIRTIDPADTVRGQYGSYTSEPGIDPCSRTETFAALRLFIDSERWQSVPVYLQAGKKLSAGRTEIHIVFKSVTHSLFPGIRTEDLQQDVLHLSIQPGEGMALTLQAKKPGPKLCMGALSLCYEADPACAGTGLDAYGRLLLDCQLSDQTLFVSSDLIESSWELFQGVLDVWASDPSSVPLNLYVDGSEGPPESGALLKRDNRKWLRFPGK